VIGRLAFWVRPGRGVTAGRLYGLGEQAAVAESMKKQVRYACIYIHTYI